MKKWKKVFGGLGIIASSTVITTVVACSNQKQQDDAKAVLENQRWLSNIWNTVSAEKNAMTLTQYNSAIKQFDALVDSQSDVFDLTKVKVENEKVKISNTDNGKSIPVVFMDIDETILNNYAYQNWLVLHKQSFSSKTWDEFVKAKISKKLAGAFEFIEHVWKKGGVVFFNSNREQENQLEPTKQNLIAQGLPAKYLEKWVWWMQGVDLSKDKPWMHIKKENNKRVKTEKEERMNLVNSKKLDLSGDNQVEANNVSFKVVMRVGDNFDDFNDIASVNKSNKERNDILKEIGPLFGNFSKEVKGIKYTKANGMIKKENESWAEGYVLIGGNSSYGGFEKGLDKNYYKLSKEDQVKALKNAFNEWKWKD
ncbi:HAD family acid phosphatase [Mycoplasmopsis cynos]|uniref:HAD family acid phosphatase n=1 Tax=Mycoplasmopsis cynos TaxID=171284 RepID=UPI002AFEA168|nr:HAD family acid phosphatase [Mycoplasmopsis cynos]WQQ19220.1 HAD family acid phosphatase [Mycoplasmopsis cynos]